MQLLIIFFLYIMLTFPLFHSERNILVVLVKILDKSHPGLSNSPKPPNTK